MKVMILLFMMISNVAFSQSFKNEKEAKLFFEELDDLHNVAMVNKDTSFLTNYYDDTFINCTRSGEINNKEEEIKSLVAMQLTKVERVAPKYDVFVYDNKVVTFTTTKRLSWKNSPISYVRRTIVFKLLNGKWKAVSGQGTYVQPKYVEE